MTLDEIIEMLQNPGEDGVPDTIYDDLRNVHNEAISGASAKIAELENSLGENTAEITRLKSANWDLFQQIPSTGDEETIEDIPDDEIGIDDLFEKSTDETVTL